MNEDEIKTVEYMILYYCKKKHTSSALCSECRELKDYAIVRLAKCKYGINKPICRKCGTHCYNTENREKIKIVMKYSGPRLILIKPGMAIRHIVKGMRKK